MLKLIRAHRCLSTVACVAVFAFASLAICTTTVVALTDSGNQGSNAAQEDEAQKATIKDIKTLQQELRRRGFDIVIDGDAGRQTRGVLNPILKNNKLSPVSRTQVLTKGDIKKFLTILQKMPLQEPERQLSVAEFKKLQTMLWVLGKYTGKSDGRLTEDSEKALLDISATFKKNKTANRSKLTENILKEVEIALSKEVKKQNKPKRIKNIQHNLTYLGYYSGKITGVVKTPTRAAIEEFLEKEHDREYISSITSNLLTAYVIGLIENADAAHDKRALQALLNAKSLTKKQEQIQSYKAFLDKFRTSRRAQEVRMALEELTGKVRTVEKPKKKKPPLAPAKPVRLRGYKGLTPSQEAVVIKTIEQCTSDNKTPELVAKSVFENALKGSEFAPKAALLAGLSNDGITLKQVTGEKTPKNVSLETIKNLNLGAFLRDSSQGLGPSFVSGILSEGYRLVIFDKIIDVKEMISKLPPSEELRKKHCLDFIAPIYFAKADKKSRVYFAFSRILEIEYQKNAKPAAVGLIYKKHGLFSLLLKGSLTSSRNISNELDQLLILDAKKDPFSVLLSLTKEKSQPFRQLYPVQL